MTQDEFVEQELRPQTENTLIQEIILSAIATKEDITVSDKELDKELDDLSKQTGSSVEELMGDMSREDIRSYLQQEKVLKWLSNNVTIEEVEETESLDAFGNETEAETAAVSETEAETEEAAEVTAQTEAADENKAETETEEA
jgi:trigger factor